MSKVQTMKDIFGLGRSPVNERKAEELRAAAKEEASLTALLSSLTTAQATEIRSKINQLRQEVPQNTNNPGDKLICQWASIYRVPVLKGRVTKGLRPFVATREEASRLRWRDKLVILCTLEVVPEKTVGKQEPDDTGDGDGKARKGRGFQAKKPDTDEAPVESTPTE